MLKLFQLLLIISVLFTTSRLVAQCDVSAYIDRYDSIAVAIMLEHQFPASLVLGLAIHESGAGTSRICREQCNHFGMKGKQISTHKKKGYTFRHLEFETDEASFFQFASLVRNRKFYDKLKGNPDPLLWLKALKRSGYAASSRWVSRVYNIIKKYNLTAFDKPMADKIPIQPDTLSVKQQQ